MKTKFHSPFILIFLLFILSFNISLVNSQPNTNPDNHNSSSSFDNDNNNNLYTNPKFSPSIAIIVVILVAALFFMAFFSMYIRQCSDNTNLGRGNSARNGLVLAQRDRTLGGGRLGLETSVIQTFPMFSYSEVRDHQIGKGALECAVCLNEFEDDETLRLIPKCDHVFHPECIDVWLENHVTCPVCRCNLTPQAGDEPYRLPELDQENNNDVAVQVDELEEAKPEVNRVRSSFKYSNRPPRSQSMKGGGGGGRNGIRLGKFRSHSTGHFIQPGENVDRFTLRLPEELRKQMMNRALLNRAKSVVAVNLPRDGSSTTRRWFRTGLGEGSMKGTSSLTKVNEPDRWQFFTRKVSSKSIKVMEENGEGTTSAIETTQSFKNKEPKNIDEKSLLRTESVQPSYV